MAKEFWSRLSKRGERILVVRNRRVDEGIGQKNKPESNHRKIETGLKLKLD
jgi:hypothetical protein